MLGTEGTKTNKINVLKKLVVKENGRRRERVRDRETERNKPEDQ